MKELMAELSQLLATEKAFLLGGDYDKVGAIASQKDALAAALDRALNDSRIAAQLPAYRRQIRRIAEAAQENEALLNGAKAGAALASARVKEILSRQRVVGVYGESGEKLLAPDASVTRRKLA